MYGKGKFKAFKKIYILHSTQHLFLSRLSLSIFIFFFFPTVIPFILLRNLQHQTPITARFHLFFYTCCIHPFFPKPCLTESPPPSKKGEGEEGEKSSTDSFWSCKQRTFDHVFSYEPFFFSFLCLSVFFSLVVLFCFSVFFFYKIPSLFCSFAYAYGHIFGDGGERVLLFFVFHPFLRMGGGSWGLLVD